MEIFQDCFFSIGKTHKICQDYAVTEPGIICVSDGCSSSNNSDFGSRILIKIAIQHYKNNKSINPIAIMDKCFECCSVLDLNYSALDATLLFATIENNKFNIVMAGDGTIVARKKDKSVVIKNIFYKGNAPLYLSYFKNPGRKKAREEMYDCTKTIETITIIPGTTQNPAIEETSINEIENFTFNCDEYEMVSLMTDGIQSFSKEVISQTTKTVESCNDLILISNLIDYKNYNGQFVQRRCQKYLKECYDQKIINNDDFTIATIFTR
jgi:hypothetical protein